MGRIGELVAPAAWGTDFRRLLASTWTTNLADGLAVAAGPLLVASLTSDPFLVALAATVQWLPQLLLGLLAGGVADRVDRRRHLLLVNTIRVGILLGLAAGVVAGVMTIAVALVLLFLLAVAEVFADTTSATLLPMLVDRSALPTANARLQGGFLVGNQLAGPAIGAGLFAVAVGWPFVAQVVLVAVGTVVLVRLRLPKLPTPATTRRLHHDIAAGFRWSMRHPAVRTLILTILIFNVTFGATWSILVLYATQRLGLGPLGFGLLTTVQAVGGLVGITVYGALARRIALGVLMRVGLVIETAFHLVLAVTSSPWVAAPTMFALGIHEFVWGTTSTTIRQRAVPQELQGRVGGVYRTAVFGGLVVGSTVGGVLAQHYGVTAPLWFAFAGSAVFVAVIWGQLPHLDRAGQDDANDEQIAGSGD